MKKFKCKGCVPDCIIITEDSSAVPPKECPWGGKGDWEEMQEEEEQS